MSGCINGVCFNFFLPIFENRMIDIGRDTLSLSHTMICPRIGNYFCSTHYFVFINERKFINLTKKIVKFKKKIVMKIKKHVNFSRGSEAKAALISTLLRHIIKHTLIRSLEKMIILNQEPVKLLLSFKYAAYNRTIYYYKKRLRDYIARCMYYKLPEMIRLVNQSYSLSITQNTAPLRLLATILPQYTLTTEYANKIKVGLSNCQFDSLTSDIWTCINKHKY